MDIPKTPNGQDSEIEWKAGDYEPHPVGVYTAEFAKWEKDEHEEYGLRIRLHFETEPEDEDEDAGHISTWTKPSLHPKGRVRPMLAAMGVDVSQIDVKDFRLSDYLGKRLLLAIEHEPRKDGQGIKASIKSFLPLPKKKKRVAVEDDEAETSGDRAASSKPATEKPKAAAGSAKSKYLEDDED